LQPVDVGYRDQHGYLRTCRLTDHMDFVGLLGISERVPRAVRSATRPGDWVIDIGANVGNVTSQLCGMVGPKGLVWAIEPLPRNVARLDALARDNALRQLRVFNVAAGANDGSADLRLPTTGHSGWASFTKSWDTKGTVNVPIRRVDDLVAENRPSVPLRFVKIDVEGYEYEVLRGAGETLRRYRPLVLCEFNDILLKDAGLSASGLIEMFHGLGYRPVDGRVAESLDRRVADVLLEPY